MSTGLKLVMAAVATAGLFGVAWADDTNDVDVTVQGELAWVSSYVWRGQVLSDDAVVQPALTVEKAGFSINVWANYDTSGHASSDGAQFNEVDLTGSYSRQFGPVELTGSYAEYLFPHQTREEDSTITVDEREIPAKRGVAYPGTREISLSASLPDLPVVPQLTVVKDIDEAEGYYAAAGLSYSHDLITDSLTVDMGASLGFASAAYNRFYFGVDRDTWNDVNVAASITYSVTEALALTPGVQYTWLLDSDIRDGAATTYGEKDRFLGSIKLTYDF